MTPAVRKIIQDHSAVFKGFSVGRCRWEQLDPSYRIGKETAHAHNARNHLAGWICVPSIDVLSDVDTIRHEIAHLYHLSQGHTDAWRRTLIRIGGSLEPSAADIRANYLLGYHKESALNVHHPKCPCHKAVKSIAN